MILDNYKTIFDCDGVVLNSNAIKTNAFYKLSKPFGDASAKILLIFIKIMVEFQDIKSLTTL